MSDDIWDSHDDELIHYGKKGMKWGVRSSRIVKVGPERQVKIIKTAARGGKKAVATTVKVAKKSDEVNTAVLDKAIKINAKHQNRAAKIIADKAKSQLTLKKAAPNVAITLKAGKKATEAIKNKLGDRTLGEAIGQSYSKRNTRRKQAAKSLVERKKEKYQETKEMFTRRTNA